MEHIDAILYINLEHRTDRNEHILGEIHKICKDYSKIHRIDAIKRDPGALGCGLSHIKALEFALEHPEWKNILILEDDFTFKLDDSTSILNDIGTAMNLNIIFNMMLLSYGTSNIKYLDTQFNNIKQIIYYF